MKPPSPSWTAKLSRPVAVMVLGSLALYWGWHLQRALTLQYAEDWSRLWGFMRWLSGYVVILGALAGLAALNLRGPYRWWYRRPELRGWYYAWLGGLGLAFYQLLQARNPGDWQWVEENLLISGLGLGLVVAFTTIAAVYQTRNEQARQLQQQAQAELRALQAQLQPHFLFNALNLIYSEALQAAEPHLARQVEELSGILRFSLTQAQQEWVDLGEELTFLQRYLALQRARLPQPERLTVDWDWDEVPARIPPLLLLPFVENVFRHSLHADPHTRARLSLRAEDGYLHFEAHNDLPAIPAPSGTGQGIANARRRLKLLLPDQHQLHIRPDDRHFSIILRLQLSTHDLASHRHR